MPHEFLELSEVHLGNDPVCTKHVTYHNLCSSPGPFLHTEKLGMGPETMLLEVYFLPKGG